MKRITSVLTTLSLLLTICAGSFTTIAQQPNEIQDPFDAGKNFTRKMHPSAVIGSTPERKAAWERLTPEQQAQAIERFRGIIEDVKKKALADKPEQKRTAVDSTLAFTDKTGKRLLVKAKTKEVGKPGVEIAPMICFDCDPDPCIIHPSLCEPDPTPTPTPTPNPTATPTPTPTPNPTATPTPTPSPQSGTDADLDGLPESFENSVADQFTPYYHVSAGEQVGIGFATFGNFVPQTVQQVFPSVPPISNFRVKPAGFRTDAYGNQWGYLQLDYLTLWNRDNGLAIGGLCEAGLSVSLGLAGYSFSQILPALTDHPLDNERSAVLIAAPVSGYNTYNLNPLAYSAYQFFTAAHEDTFTDQSLLFSPSQPVPAGLHIELGFSLSKHGTYPFNPDYLPLVPYYIIYSTYATIDFLYWYGYISYYEYLAYLFTADSAYFACAVERFNEQGGIYALPRTNVGELNNPINNSNFIQDTELTNKLSKVFIF